MVDGKLLAFAEEERFTRLKNSHNMFPGNSVNFCLKQAGVSLDEVSMIAVPYDSSFYPWKFMLKMGAEYLKLGARTGFFRGGSDNAFEILNIAGTRSGSFIRKYISDGLLSYKIRGRMPVIKYVDHHVSHAVSAAYYSGFASALVFIIDGSGEAETTTIFKFCDGELRLLEKRQIPHSLGWFYAGITDFLGFQAYRSEGKTMGLAPYGMRDDALIEKLGKVLVNPGNRYLIRPEFLLAGSHSYGVHFSDKMVDLLGAPRHPAEPLTQRHRNIAWATQYLLEKTVKEIVDSSIKRYGLKNVCLSGGVAMNCKMNGAILYETSAENVFVFPAAGDAGSSIGAACVVSGTEAKEKRAELRHTYFGPSFSAEEILADLRLSNAEFTRPDNIAREVAGLLGDGRMVGWFQGRMEFGARALGNRSILANPLIPGIKDKVNDVVKFRENWRPFCPSMLNEQRGEYMQKDITSPFMIVAHKLKEKYRAQLSSVSHIDGSIRPQTVTKEQNPLYYDLLSEVRALTGQGILLNTSFNVRGEPIVCAPLEAVRCFYGNGLDALAIGPYLLKKKKIA